MSLYTAEDFMPTSAWSGFFQIWTTNGNCSVVRTIWIGSGSGSLTCARGFSRRARFWAPVTTSPPLVLVVWPRQLRCLWLVRKSRFPHILASLVGRLLHSLCSHPQRSPLASGSGTPLVGNQGFPPLSRSPAGMALQSQRKACAYMWGMRLPLSFYRILSFFNGPLCNNNGEVIEFFNFWYMQTELHLYQIPL